MEIAGLFRWCCRPTAELLHPIDKLRDAVHLSRDQACKRTVTVARAAFEQLACPADRGKGILDFVRQYGWCAQFDALIAILVTLSLPDFREGQHAPTRMGGHGRTGQIDAPLPIIDRQRQVPRHELRFGIGEKRGNTRLLEPRECGDGPAAQPRFAASEQFLGHRIHLRDPMVGIDDQYREDHAGDHHRRIGHRQRGRHAARRCRNGS